MPLETEILIHNDYKPPAILHVSSATRKTLLEQYYSRNTFLPAIPPVRDWLKQWVETIPERYQTGIIGFVWLQYEIMTPLVLFAGPSPG